MKLGILQCDSVLEEYQPSFGNYPQMFVDLFKRVDPKIETQIYNVQFGEYPSSIHHCDAYVTTGSKASVYEDLDWLNQFKQFIIKLHDNKIKLAAICFGHQLIAEIFGGKTEKSDKGWGVGVSVNQIIKHKPWMQPPLDELNIIVSHQDQVITLPKGAELLGTSDFCPNYLYQLDNLILSIQGHPEFSKAYSEALMKHRIDRIGKNTLELGIQSLDLETHEKEFIDWILHFFRQR